MQVPIVGTEFTPAEERAKQAATHNPLELRALKKNTNLGSLNTPRLLDSSIQVQDSNGLVPGGSIVYLVWEIVPGLRLGDACGPSAFWALDKRERSEIQAAFPREYEYDSPLEL